MSFSKGRRSFLAQTFGAAMLMAGMAAPSWAVNIADSAADFSGVQGANGWQYGRYVPISEPTNPGPGAFSQLTNFTGTEWNNPGGAFNTPIIGLTGSPAQVEQVKKQFGVYSAKVPTEGGGYSVDHTATVFLLDRNGSFVATLSPDEGDSPALDKLRRIAAA